MGSKKLIAFILCIVMILSVTAGCGSKENAGETGKRDNAQTSNEQTQNENKDVEDDTPSYLNKEGFPIVKEPITLRFMVKRTAVQPPHEEIYVWQEYEKMTGIKIEWINVPDTDLAEKRNLAIASGDLPDVFIRCGFSDLDVLRYGEQGVFIELNDLIDKYAPNLKACMDKYPEVGSGLPEYNGKIYAAPVLYDSEAVLMGLRFFVRKTWIDKLGLSMPTNTDELYQVLKAFKEQDPNGNGKADEIPWTTASIDYVVNSLKGAWGLQNRGSKHPNVDMDEETNELRFIPITDGYKEMLQYINKLYTEGLLDQEIFTMDHAKLIAKGEQDLVGAFNFANSQAVGASHEQEYEGIASFPAPIILALLINEVHNTKFKRIVQTITYAPHFLSTVVLVGMLTTFLSPKVGIVNNLIEALGGERIYFMAEPAWFKHMYVWSGVWQHMGWNAIIYLAALTTIGPELHEAAIIDGANKLQRIWHINIPGILPTAVILLILNLGQVMNVGFEKVFLMQNDLNMKASDVISTYVYRTGLLGAQYSFSTAVGLFNSVINFVLIIIVNTISRKITEVALW